MRENTMAKNQQLMATNNWTETDTHTRRKKKDSSTHLHIQTQHNMNDKKPFELRDSPLHWIHLSTRNYICAAIKNNIPLNIEMEEKDTVCLDLANPLKLQAYFLFLSFSRQEKKVCFHLERTHLPSTHTQTHTLNWEKSLAEHTKKMLGQKSTERAQCAAGDEKWLSWKLYWQIGNIWKVSRL